jgi:hypothetical protein
MKADRIVGGVVLSLLLLTGVAQAVPETVSVRVTDVSPISFAVVWLTDVPAEPAVEVFADASRSTPLSDRLRIEAYPDASEAVKAAARAKGVMKVRVSGLETGTNYYLRTVTRDPANPVSVGYSSMQQVTTASAVIPYREQSDGSLTHAANDLFAFRAYVRPSDASASPRAGDLLVLQADPSAYPVSGFVGEGVAGPEGILDLNNLFDFDGLSLDLTGGERATLRVYRGGTLSTLLHYRRFPVDGGEGRVGDAVRGFFADFNLDGKVDEDDFDLFRAQYRTVADDGAFNPDLNLIPVQPGGGVVAEDRIDARDFARFATEYGNRSVQE